MKDKQSALPTFDSRFIDSHMGNITKNPVNAINELVANAWDAGAEKILITWPGTPSGGNIIIEDDGEGMTYDHFSEVWRRAGYNRIENQREQVVLSDGSMRHIYGKNGIGRFGMFYFTDQYMVETWRDGTSNTFEITKSENLFDTKHLSSVEKDGHGTKIWCERGTKASLVTDEALSEIIQSNFFNAHLFKIIINGKEIIFEDQQPVRSKEYNVRGFNVAISRYDLNQKKNLKKTDGIMWRVNDRAVGNIDWSRIKYKLGGRSEAKKHLVVVDADHLARYVERDWSGFQKNKDADIYIQEVVNKIEDFLSDIINEMKKTRKERAIKENLSDLRALSGLDRECFNEFIEEVLIRCPNMTGEDLSNVAGALATMEKSRSKYALIAMLSDADSEGIDSLNDVLSTWSIKEMKVVFDELNNRMDIVKKLHEQVNDKKIPEVTVLQPIFERALWMFGPEYDSVSFTSNRSISTVLRELFKCDGFNLPEKGKRPDFVITPAGSSLGTYSALKFDYDGAGGEARGYQKVVIVELKRGGSKIGMDELTQAAKYAMHLKSSGKINGNPIYYCYVLGSSTDVKKAEYDEKTIFVEPISYDSLLSAAEARLFNLIEKMRSENEDLDKETDISKAIRENAILDSSFINRETHNSEGL